MKNKHRITGRFTWFITFCLPLIVFFHRDLQTWAESLNPAIMLIMFALPILLFLIVIAGHLFQVQSKQKINNSFNSNVIALFFVFLIFITFNMISILKEISIYHLNQPLFNEIATQGTTTDCYLSSNSCIEYMQHPETNLFAENEMFVISDSEERLVGIRSRFGTYYVNSETNLLGISPKVYQYYVSCTHELANDWYICNITSGS